MEHAVDIFEERRGRLLAALRVKRPVYVALVSSDKAYGGPEEGGWYFDTQAVVEQTHAGSIAGILAIVNDMRQRYSNEGNYEPSSILCTGWYRILVRTKPSRNEPECRPRYE